MESEDTMTLAATLEAALIGQATKKDVIEAIDAELTGKATVLVSNMHKAAAQALKLADKPSKEQDFPIMSTLLFHTHEGRLLVTPFAWDERKEKTQIVPARVDVEFSACVPAKQFTNWMKASQLTKEEKSRGVSQQVVFTYCPRTCILTIQTGNSRAQFKCIDAREFPAV